MKIEDILKKLKVIEPDPAWSRRSRMSLLGAQMESAPSRGPWGILVHSFQFGSVVALTAVLLVLVVGGFSAWQVLSPWRALSLDPVGLRAEAQAVDIQIQLTSVSYPEPFDLKNNTSTVPIASHLEGVKEGTSSAPLTLDEALEMLAE